MFDKVPRFDKVEARLHVAADLAEGAKVGASPEQAHYLRSVLRLSPGAAVALFNGRHGEWRARLDGIGKGRATLAVESRVREQTAEPDLWFLFAPIKRARIDFLAQKATELGVSLLWPVMTRHTAVERVNEDRLSANALEAAEQSDRLSVPETRPPTALWKALDGWPAGRRLLLCDEGGGGAPIVEALAGLDPGPSSSPWAVLTGPEGGFSADELSRLRALPYAVPVGLGPRVLRADTAALAALAVLQAVAGDWRNGRPGWEAR